MLRYIALKIVKCVIFLENKKIRARDHFEKWHSDKDKCGEIIFSDIVFTACRSTALNNIKQNNNIYYQLKLFKLQFIITF